MENTKIEWAVHTWNPWFGCSKVGPGCDFCYAEAIMDARLGKVQWGGDRVRTKAGTWAEPLKWNKAAAAAGRFDTVFCLSLGDIWDNEVPPAWRRDAFNVMRQTPYLIYLLLSKRIGNARKMCDPEAGNDTLPGNAALGATLINQEEWDRDMPKLKAAGRDLGAMFTFASVEPMLGPIDCGGLLPDWIICGGESGHHARPMRPDWARSLRDQCAKAGVPFLFKQWGEHFPAELSHVGPDGEVWRKRAGGGESWALEEISHGLAGTAERVVFDRVGKGAAGRLLDGVEHNGKPA